MGMFISPGNNDNYPIQRQGRGVSFPFPVEYVSFVGNFINQCKEPLWTNYSIRRLQICPLYIFGNNPPQMVPVDLNIGETRVSYLANG